MGNGDILRHTQPTLPLSINKNREKKTLTVHFFVVVLTISTLVTA